MTKRPHPSNRFARRQLDSKHNVKKEKVREGRVRRKLYKEYAKTQEAENELREHSSNG